MEGQHVEINNKFKYLGKFEFIFKTGLGWRSVGWGTFFILKTRGKIPRDTVPLSNKKFGFLSQ
jgi:hypothetical protein